jgi:hypothetical protein
MRGGCCVYCGRSDLAHRRILELHRNYLDAEFEFAQAFFDLALVDAAVAKD